MFCSQRTRKSAVYTPPQSFVLCYDLAYNLLHFPIDNQCCPAALLPLSGLRLCRLTSALDEVDDHRHRYSYNYHYNYYHYNHRLLILK